MHDLVEFFAQCARSGTLLASLCAIVIIPAGAWLACRVLVSRIVCMTDDPAWQAPLAALAAALPGALFVALWIGALFGGLSSACLSLPAGRVVLGTIIAAMIAALVRATWLAFARFADIRRLLRSSSDPSPRLRQIAMSCGLKARELQDEAPICVLAGIVSPCALVSTAALSAITDNELRAALHHEQAHARRGDQILAALLSFLTDLLPLPATDLIDTYKMARELAADEYASIATDAESLAGALIKFAKGGRSLVATAGLVDGRKSGIATRLQTLLRTESRKRQPNALNRLIVSAALAVIALAGVTTPALASRQPATCSITMSAQS